MAKKKQSEERFADFIESWGSMGSVWGLNNSMARVHALLMTCEEPIALDDIAERLQISRGNASMSLRELRGWGVARLVKKPGDRRDYYVTEPDVWKMLFAIVRERKRRELDPLLSALKSELARPGAAGGGLVETRLRDMAEILSTLDRLSSMLLADDERARTLLAMLAGGMGGMEAVKKA